MDSNVSLWQFLLELLLSQKHVSIIDWTDSNGEFKLYHPEMVAKLWGVRKNKPNMNYDKLSRALRYYYEKDIIKKANSKKFVYRFVNLPQTILNQINARNSTQNLIETFRIEHSCSSYENFLKSFESHIKADIPKLLKQEEATVFSDEAFDKFASNLVITAADSSTDISDNFTSRNEEYTSFNYSLVTQSFNKGLVIDNSPQQKSINSTTFGPIIPQIFVNDQPSEMIKSEFVKNEISSGNLQTNYPENLQVMKNNIPDPPSEPLSNSISNPSNAEVPFMFHSAGFPIFPSHQSFPYMFAVQNINLQQNFNNINHIHLPVLNQSNVGINGNVANNNDNINKNDSNCGYIYNNNNNNNNFCNNEVKMEFAGEGIEGMNLVMDLGCVDANNNIVCGKEYMDNICEKNLNKYDKDYMDKIYENLDKECDKVLQLSDKNLQKPRGNAPNKEEFGVNWNPQALTLLCASSKHILNFKRSSEGILSPLVVDSKRFCNQNSDSENSGKVSDIKIEEDEEKVEEKEGEKNTNVQKFHSKIKPSPLKLPQSTQMFTPIFSTTPLFSQSPFYSSKILTPNLFPLLNSAGQITPFSKLHFWSALSPMVLNSPMKQHTLNTPKFTVSDEMLPDKNVTINSPSASALSATSSSPKSSPSSPTKLTTLSSLSPQSILTPPSSSSPSIIIPATTTKSIHPLNLSIAPPAAHTSPSSANVFRFPSLSSSSIMDFTPMLNDVIDDEALNTPINLMTPRINPSN